MSSSKGENAPSKEPHSFIRTFLMKLRKRRIIETLAAFIAGGWLLIEVVERLLVSHYRFPDKTIDITVVSIIGVLACTLIWLWFRGTEKRPGNVKAEVLLVPLIILATLTIDLNLILQITGFSGRRLTISIIAFLVGIAWIVFKSLQWAAQIPGTGRTEVSPFRPFEVKPEKPFTPVSPESAKTPEPPFKDLTRGSTFARRYDIIEELGKGGMGKVYRVYDRKIEEEVALKLIRPDIAADQEMIDRFRNELKLSRKISHRNVSRIHDLGEEEGTYYITMEYVPGEDLKSLIHISKQLSVGTAISIAKQVCEGLEEAHRLGVIHRDLKPGNIMIDKEGNARIMDFGIARSLAGKSITGTGVMIGTPAYMSPEQVEGKEIDQRSDIYSLGIILYEMVTGRVPFDGDTPFTVGVKHKSEIPKSPKELNPQMPDDLSHGILRCLEKDKELRYQSAWELRSELEKIERGIPTTQRVMPEKKPFTSKEITVKFELKRLLVSASVVTLLVLGAVVIRSVLPRKRMSLVPKIENSIAVITFENQTGDKAYDYLQKAIPNLFITNLEKAGYLNVVTWERLYDLQKQVGKSDVDIIDKELGFKLCQKEGIEFIALGSFIKAGNMFAMDIKVLDVESKKLLKSANSKGEGLDSILRTQIDELSKEISLGVGTARQKIDQTQFRVIDVTTASIEAYKFYIEGEEIYWREYEDYKAMQLFEKAVEIDPDFAMAQYLLGMIKSFLGDEKASSKAFEKAISLSNKVTERERLLIAAGYESDSEKRFRLFQELAKKYPKEKQAYFQLGHSYWAKRMLKEAIVSFSKAVELDPYWGMALDNISLLYGEMKNFDKAIEYEKRRIAMSPGKALPVFILGDIFSSMGKFDEAIAKYKEALDLNPEQFFVYFYIADAYAKKEDYLETMYWIDRYIEKGPLSLKATGYFIKGFYSYWLGRFDACMQSLGTADKLSEETGNTMAKYWTQMLKGLIYCDRGELELSEKQFKNYLDFGAKAIPEAALVIKGQYSFFLGLIYLSRGQTGSAKSNLEDLRLLSPKIDPAFKYWLKYYEDYLAAEILIKENSPEKAIAVLEKTSLLENVPWEISMTYMVIFYNMPFYEDGLARAYQEKGDLDKAIAEYEKLMTFGPNRKEAFYIHPKYHYRLALLYEKKGVRIKAIEQYQKFLDFWKDADPALPEVADARRRLAGLNQ